MSIAAWLALIVAIVGLFAFDLFFAHAATTTSRSSARRAGASGGWSSASRSGSSCWR